MKLIVATVLTIACFCIGLGTVLTVAEMAEAPSWLPLTLLGAGTVLGVAGLFGSRSIRRRSA